MTAKIEMALPDFSVGDIIVSDRYMGMITGAFWDGTWCYNIDENTSVPKNTKEGGYPVGPKFVRRGEIRAVMKHGKWQPV